MKALFCYHSQSGNTALACRFLSQRLPSVSWDVIDITRVSQPDFRSYDVLGFATWTYYLRIPPLLENILSNLPNLTGKPAFLFSTYGVMPGQVLPRMEKILKSRGLVVLDGHSLPTPESYPPYIIKGWHRLEAPTPQEMTELEGFVSRLNNHFDRIKVGLAPKPARIKVDIFSRLIPPYSLRKVRHEMGLLAVDPALCSQCGTCQQVCLYDAIGLNLPPLFGDEKCQGCWACFNHCPEKAIHTSKVRGRGQYPQPAPALISKLSARRAHERG